MIRDMLWMLRAIHHQHPSSSSSSSRIDGNQKIGPKDQFFDYHLKIPCLEPTFSILTFQLFCHMHHIKRTFLRYQSLINQSYHLYIMMFGHFCLFWVFWGLGFCAHLLAESTGYTHRHHHITSSAAAASWYTQFVTIMMHQKHAHLVLGIYLLQKLQQQ